MIKKDILLLEKQFKSQPHLAIILGSGQKGLNHLLSNIIEVEFDDLYSLPKPTIKGHPGKLVFGTLGNKNILIIYGRFHLYEGYSIKEVSILVDIVKSLGTKLLLVTNSSGCMVSSWELESYMLMTDYIDFTNYKKEIRTINKDTAFNKYFNNIILDICNQIKLKIYKGTYSWVLGPTYETKAEIQYMKQKGGHVVGMSTVPEIIRANELCLPVIGLSYLTNYSVGIIDNPLTHQEVINKASSAHIILSKIIKKLVSLIHD